LNPYKIANPRFWRASSPSHLYSTLASQLRVLPVLAEIVRC
jgi:hypothetical protein